jgi:hypothetical protein
MGRTMKSSNWTIGTSVVVKPGVTDPDTDNDISGWQGRISAIFDAEGTLAIQWDSFTLKSLSSTHIAWCEEEGLSWSEMNLGKEEVEPATTRDTEDDVAKAIAEIESRYNRLYLGGEQGIFMSDTDAKDYDTQVREIQAYNQPILAAFEAWLEQAGLSKKVIHNHVSNIDFFTDYLVYDEPLKKLDEADSGDVWSFLDDWFPRKALWASASSVKSYLASFKKFFQWMGQAGRVSPQTVADVLETLKEGKDSFLSNVAE